MNTSIHRATKCFGLYNENKIIGFIGILHHPNRYNKKIKRVTRLVILPDYQGIGLGKGLLNFIAKYYIKSGFDFFLTTSAKNLLYSLKKDENWILTRYNKASKTRRTSEKTGMDKTIRNKCKTASFCYKKNING